MPDHFWKMRSTKCARDCSESSISCQKIIIKWLIVHKLPRNWWSRNTFGNSSVSIPLFQFARLNSFVSTHSCHVTHVNSVTSFQRLHFNSFILTHSLIHSFIHSFVHSLIHSIPFQSNPFHTIHSFIHTFIRSFVHSFIHSLVRSFLHSFIHLFICSWGH